MPDHLPLVSVIIPTYNRADLLPQAVDSVLSQDYPSFEVIIVDDCSQDNTPEVVASITEKHGARVRSIRLPANSGPAAARNAGIRAAHGPLIAFQDSDDIWLPGKLTAQVAALQKHPECGLCYGKALVATPEGAATGAVYGRTDQGRTGDNFGPLLSHNPILTPTIVVRSCALHQVGLFDESLPTAEDTDLFLRLTVKCPAVYLSDPTVLVRQHEGRMTLADSRVGRQARCWLKAYGRAWDTLPQLREPLRGLVAGRLAMSVLAVAEHESGVSLDQQALEDIMNANPEWFDHSGALWHIADRLVRRERDEPGSVLSMARWLSSQPDSGSAGRRRASAFLNAAVRRGIRRGMHARAANWAVRYAHMMPRLIWDRIAGRP